MSFCHSREPSLDNALPLGASKPQDLFSSLRANAHATKGLSKKGHRHGSSSADASIRYRHRPVQSIDWINWRQTFPSDSTEDGCELKTEEDEDDDLIAYRNEAGARLAVANDGNEHMSEHSTSVDGHDSRPQAPALDTSRGHTE